jgi:N-formylglutamate amidohydrolase
VVLPHRSRLPVVLSIAHSGTAYPDWLVAEARGGRETLEALGDPWVDRLAWRAIAAGLGAVIAQAPRAAIDCNRAVDDLDPLVVDGVPPATAAMRSRHGLGLVAGRTQRHGHLWRRRLGLDEIADRVDQAHLPYHRAIARHLDEVAASHGTALLLDCHSMPPRRGQPELVIGDRHGHSAAAWVTREAAKCARSMGWSVGVNDPYAGGHIVERHGAPADNIHALQLEFDRRTYLDDSLAEPGPGFDRAARLLNHLAARLGSQLADFPAMAAE